MAGVASIASSLSRISLTTRGSLQNVFSDATRLLHTSPTSCGKLKFVKAGIDISKYTMKPLRLSKTGGRGHNGRVQTHHIGGGHRQNYRMIDYKKPGPKEGPPKLEKVIEVRYDPCRTANIAVVAGEEEKRYILASSTMKPGDIIKTTRNIPLLPVHAIEGDAHPIGALPIGAMVHCLELYPEKGAQVARAAGTSAMLVRKIGDRCIVKMPSKREINISQDCMCTVGRVSNVDHNTEVIGSAARNRWFGVRPQSGKWHRKTGYNGKKINAIKSMVTYDKPPAPKPSTYRWTV